jgi:hypothetical protein
LTQFARAHKGGALKRLLDSISALSLDRSCDDARNPTQKKNARKTPEKTKNETTRFFSHTAATAASNLA